MKLTYLLPIGTAMLIVLFFACLPALHVCPTPQKLEDGKKGWQQHWFILALTLAYSVLSFFNLGDTRAPQSFRRFEGGSAVLTLQEPSAVGRVMLYTGIVQGSWTVDFSPDGELWIAAASYDQGHAALLKWEEPDMSGAPKGFSVLSGDDDMTLAFMATGAHGVISVASNIAPKEVSDMDGYTHKSGIVYKNQYHIIFCPKFRRSVLCNGVDKRLKDILLCTRHKTCRVRIFDTQQHITTMLTGK